MRLNLNNHTKLIKASWTQKDKIDSFKTPTERFQG